MWKIGVFRPTVIVPDGVGFSVGVGVAAGAGVEIAAAGAVGVGVGGGATGAQALTNAMPNAIARVTNLTPTDDFIGFASFYL